WDYQDLADMLDWDAVAAFRRRSLNPEHPVLRGTAQNPDIFFQAKEASNSYYEDIVGITEDYMNQVNAKIGKDYKLFNYYGAPDATQVIIAMGSVCDTIEETIDYLNANGEKVGLVKVRLFRPFSIKHLLSVIPASVQSISVLDRAKEPGSLGEPLYLDVIAALRESDFAGTPVFGGRYGLGSKDTTPAQIISVYRNMQSASPKKSFTIGINDDVTNLSLDISENPNTTPVGTHSCKFWGLGADGTVGANKNSIKIIGDNTDMYAQGYFSYDSKKSGGVTVSHLRFGTQPIKSTYFVSKADFVACHNPSYMDKYDIVEDLLPGGIFLLNCGWNQDELAAHLPAKVKRFIAQNDIKVYTIDATHAAKELGLGGRVNTILQAAFFKLSGIIPVDSAVQMMKDAAAKSYGKKGEKVVAMNHAAIERGVADVKEIDVDKAWADLADENVVVKVEGDRPELVSFVENILTPVNAQRGDKLPVSAFTHMADGTFPQGSSAYEKRGIAVDVPEWQPENCIQCNFCAYVCPHAVIRPAVLNKDETAAAPQNMKTLPMTGLPELNFSITVSALDCTGCGVCSQVCPGKKGNKALVMQPIDTQLPSQESFAYGTKLSEKPEVNAKFKPTSVKGSQFKQPLLEFSGACAGCTETPYAKLATQLYGDRMFIANATGCSSIWGGSAPSTPYTVNRKGFGPAWQNSLFEDNAEFGYGIFLAQKAIRDRLADLAAKLIALDWTWDELKKAAQAWLDTKDDSELNPAAAEAFIAALEEGVNLEESAFIGTEYESYWDKENKWCKCDACATARELLADRDYLTKKSVWVFGGDGWAYDIGFGGLDHVIASGEDVNILVF
ncbi:MAG: pyruvate:ferredoxin (flavodoxin) oxidoreductase, partial [Clostridiales bacterium]|nr:pyruvate:ferredoxin (flavodoxin) oxidoreductase [Clostridiales bacterium]